MADSSRVQISYLKQDSKGTVPNSAFTAVRHTGGTFGLPQETVRSNEIRDDAQRGGAVRTGLNPEGTINLELSAKTFDDLIQGLMRSTWSTAVAISDSDIQANNSNSSFDSATVDFTGTNAVVGQWVYVQGFDTDGANGWFKITAIAAGELTVSPAPSADTNSGNNTITIEGSYIRNGTDSPYFAFQLEHQDLTDKYRLISDAKIGQMDLSSNARERVTGSLQFIGRSHELKTAKSGNGSVDSAPTTEILNSTDHVTGVFINGSAYDGGIMNFSLSANMNARRQNAVGEVMSEDIGLGSLDLAGNLSIYLTDNAWTNLLQKYIDFTKISIAFAFVDADGNGYVIELPQIALTNEPGNVPGPDEDIMLEFDFEAEPGTVGNEEKTIQISRRQAA